MIIVDTARDAGRVLHAAPLWLIAIATALAVLADAAGMFGLPLLLLAASWVWTYTFLIIESLAHGRPLPVLSIERTNPWHDPAPLAPLVVAAALGLALAGPLEERWELALAGVLGLGVLPASLALLAVEGHLGRAFWPPSLARVIGGLGARYGAVVALGTGGVLLTRAVAPRAPLGVTAALAQLALFGCAAALGGALFRCRERLGIEACSAPERQEQKDRRAADAAAEAVATELYALVRVRRLADASRLAQTWLDDRGNDPALIRWLFERALAWGEPRLAARLEGRLIGRLLELRRDSEAAGILERAWQRGREPLLRVQDVPALSVAARRLGLEAVALRLAERRPDPPPAN